MKVVERINSTQVRHEWKTIAEGVAAGKSFIVENHGKPEAIVSPPTKNSRRTTGFDLQAHFARVKKLPLHPLEIQRAPEL